MMKWFISFLCLMLALSCSSCFKTTPTLEETEQAQQINEQEYLILDYYRDYLPDHLEVMSNLPAYTMDHTLYPLGIWGSSIFFRSDQDLIELNMDSLHEAIYPSALEGFMSHTLSFANDIGLWSIMDHDSIYFFSYAPSQVCLASIDLPSKNIRWKTPLDGLSHEVNGKLIHYKDTIIAFTSSMAYGIHQDTGSIEWIIPFEELIDEADPVSFYATNANNEGFLMSSTQRPVEQKQFFITWSGKVQTYEENMQSFNSINYYSSKTLPYVYDINGFKVELMEEGYRLQKEGSSHLVPYPFEDEFKENYLRTQLFHYSYQDKIVLFFRPFGRGNQLGGCIIVMRALSRRR